MKLDENDSFGRKPVLPRIILAVKSVKHFVLLYVV